MYRAIELVDEDKDLHRFVWRNSSTKDYRMTRITFGVSASSFIANMCVKQNASDHALEYYLQLNQWKTHSMWMMVWQELIRAIQLQQ